MPPNLITVTCWSAQFFDELAVALDNEQTRQLIDISSRTTAQRSSPARPGWEYLSVVFGKMNTWAGPGSVQGRPFVMFDVDRLGLGSRTHVDDEARGSLHENIDNKA